MAKSVTMKSWNEVAPALIVRPQKSTKNSPSLETITEEEDQTENDTCAEEDGASDDQQMSHN